MDLAYNLTCNITNPNDCGMNGECSMIFGKAKCICDKYYDPLTKCQSLYLYQLNKVDIVVLSLMIILYILFSISMVFEIIIDVKRNKHKISLKKPLFLSKCIYLVNILYETINSIIVVYERNNHLKSSQYSITVSPLSGTLLACTYCIIIVKWITLIHKVVKMDENIKIPFSIKIVKIIFMIEFIVIYPSFAILRILWSVNIGGDVLYYIHLIIGMIAILTLLFIPPYLFINGLIYLNKIEIEGKQIKMAILKTKFLFITHTGFSLVFITITRNIIYNTRTYSAWPQFIWEIILSTFLPSILGFSGMFLFLQNYLLRKGNYIKQWNQTSFTMSLNTNNITNKNNKDTIKSSELNNVLSSNSSDYTKSSHELYNSIVNTQ